VWFGFGVVVVAVVAVVVAAVAVAAVVPVVAAVVVAAVGYVVAVDWTNRLMRMVVVVAHPGEVETRNDGEALRYIP